MNDVNAPLCLQYLPRFQFSSVGAVQTLLYVPVEQQFRGVEQTDARGVKERTRYTELISADPTSSRSIENASQLNCTKVGRRS